MKQKYNWFESAKKHGFDLDKVPEYLFTPNRWKKPRYKGKICVDLFAGIGGASLGFKQAGIHTPIAVDFEKWAMLTYMANLGKNPRQPVCYIHKDIRQVTGAEIVTKLEEMGYEPFIDIIWGSPPCQDFSSANTVYKNKLPPILQTGRRYCMLEFIRLVQELRPQCFVMENVPGLVQGKMRPLFDEFLSRLKWAGYQVTWKILNAADYGVPQNRHRVITIGMDAFNIVEHDPITPVLLA